MFPFSLTFCFLLQQLLLNIIILVKNIVLKENINEIFNESDKQ